MVRDAFARMEQVKGVSRETLKKLTVFHDLLLQWQKRINLIAPSTIDHIWDRHILDSLQVYEALDGADEIVDIGSGAGFPGIVIAILLAEQQSGTLTMVESNGKKCAFLNAAIRALDLRNASIQLDVVNKRIENAVPDITRPKTITARALAPLDELIALSQDYLQAGTIGVFPKGKDHQRELEKARALWRFDCEQIDSELAEGSVILKISDLRPL